MKQLSHAGLEVVLVREAAQRIRREGAVGGQRTGIEDAQPAIRIGR